MTRRLDPLRMAREMALVIGREVMLARTNQALTIRAAARLAGVAPSTQQRVEAGDPAVGVDTVCRVAAPIGLKVWGRAFPAGTPTLRDTGQLAIAEFIRTAAAPSMRVVLEHGLGHGRAIDAVLLGVEEIIAVEIERLLADLQAQYRAADAKRQELAAGHQRPVRLVLAVEDTRHNRKVAAEHASIIRSMMPAGSREVMRAIRTGEPLRRDGLLWIRPSRRR
jgi:transcriptional regulator with XRE-family HTH domain